MVEKEYCMRKDEYSVREGFIVPMEGRILHEEGFTQLEEKGI